MGGGGSQTINQAFNMSAINKSIYEQITKTQASASASQATIQNLSIEFRDISGCKVDASQTIDAEAISSSELTLEIQNIVENTIVTETINEAIAEQVAIQNNRVVFRDCKDSDLDFSQNVTAKVAAKVITTALQDAIASSEVMNQLSAAADASQKSENKGLTDLVKGFFEGLYGPIKYAMIACVVCCCLLVLVMIVLGLSPAGQSATANLGKGAAARLGNARKF